MRRSLSSLRLVKSILLRQPPKTGYSNLSPSLPSSSSFTNQNVAPYASLNHFQTRHFSSKPTSLVELVSTNEWSEALEKELEKSNPKQTHETVLYVLKKLDRNPDKALNFFTWVTDKKGFKPSSILYSLMLRTLGRKETMKDFWVLIKKMFDQGFDIDDETFKTLLSTFSKEKMVSDAAALTEVFNKMVKESATEANVRSVAEIIQGSDWDDNVEKKLEELKVTLSEDSVLRVLRELRSYPFKALEFFEWAVKHQSFERNAVTYNAIVRVLGREESIEKFWEMVKEMKSAGYEMDIDTYIKLSRQFQKCKMMEHAVELYEFMMDGPYKPSVQDCSSLLRQISLAPSPDLSLVFRVVKKFEGMGHSLSKAIYDGIHRSLTSVGKFEEAEKILETMRNAGYEPDNITYSQMVFGLCKAKRLEDACEVLKEMEAEGCAPDIKTWTILIQGHCAAGEVDNALTCFTDMMETECEADADLLEVLVNGLCSTRKVDSAYTLVVEMVERAKMRPWQATYKTVIEKLLGDGKLEESLHLLRLMKKHNFPPFPEPFVCYISKYGTVNDAKEYLKALSVKEYPTSSAYFNLLQSFFREGRQSEAQDLLYKCPHHIRNHVDIQNLFGASKRGETTA